MTKFIKRLGDERVSCQVTITLKSVRVKPAAGVTATKLKKTIQAPLAIQVLRGPLKSET